MKTIVATIIYLLISTFCIAGDFINLGFDDPDLSHATPYQSGPILGQSMPTSEAIQGWVLSSENTPTPSRVYIDVSTTPPVSLVSSVKLPGTGVDFGKYGHHRARTFHLCPVRTGRGGHLVAVSAAFKFLSLGLIHQFMNIHCAGLFALVLPLSSPLDTSGFVNLDFEHPDLSHLRPGIFFGPDVQVGPTKELVRGWNLSIEGVGPPVSQTYFGGGLSTSIQSAFPFPSTGVDFGKHLLSLDSSSLAPGSFQPIYHLSQLGTIPAGAGELVYMRYGAGPSGAGPKFIPGWVAPFQIFINGQSMPYYEAGISSVDVSAFAGQKVNLEFVFPEGGNYFDIAGFTIAPEPSTYAMFGLGAAALWWQCRRRCNS